MSLLPRRFVGKLRALLFVVGLTILAACAPVPSSPVAPPAGVPLDGAGGGAALVPNSHDDVSAPSTSSTDALGSGPVRVSGPVPGPWAAPPEQSRHTSPPEISALAAVVLDEASAAVLYEKNAHEPLPPASLTKIVTAILALERGDLDSWVDIDVDSLNMSRSTVMGVVPGDRFTLRDLLYGLMLPSGNDAALAIGRHISGSDEAFVAEMNALAVRLSLSDSHFLNPHGLGGRDHVASAYDLAMFARYAMRIPGFAEIVTAPGWTARGSRTIQLSNIKSFLFSYRGADGVKTGYTRSAGQTLVASATRRGHRLYAVVLNAPQRDADARRLLDWAFAEFRWPEDGQP
jgi:D-alanyl-D-alanine carboxypeptidase